MSWFTEHKTALSGAATTIIGTVTALASDPNVPAIASAINPRYGAYAAAGMGLVTTLIGVYNTWKNAQAQAAVLPAPVQSGTQ